MPEHVKDLISAYLDEELNGMEVQHVEHHLSRCPECRKELAELKELREEMTFAYSSIEAPDGFVDSVMAEIGTSSPVSKKFEAFKKWIIALLVIFMVTVLSMQIAPFLSLGAAMVTFVFNFGFELLRFISFIISKIPYMLGFVCAVAGSLILLSLWSLKRLLGMQMFT